MTNSNKQRRSAAANDPRILRGMEAQLKLRQARLSAGEKPLGWKVGFGAPAIMEQLGIDAPLIGFLTDKSRLSAETTVSVAGWAKPVLEPEIAVYMGQDLGQGADDEAIQSAIAAIGPVIELADVTFPPDDVEAILAHNIYHRHIILGRRDETRAGGMLDGLAAHVYRDGTEIATTTDPQALTGNLIETVQHVADLLTVFGESLRADEIIIAGSIVPPVWLAGQAEYRYTLDPVDTISINLAA